MRLSLAYEDLPSFTLRKKTLLNDTAALPHGLRLLNRTILDHEYDLTAREFRFSIRVTLRVRVKPRVKIGAVHMAMIRVD